MIISILDHKSLLRIKSFFLFMKPQYYGEISKKKKTKKSKQDI